LATQKTLINIYLKQNNWKEARALLDQAAKGHPHDADILKMSKNLDALGTIQEGSWDQKSARQKELLKPSVSQGAGDKTDAAASQPAELSDEARLTDLKERVGRQPSDLLLRYQLGELLFHMKKYDEAATELQQASQNEKRRVRALNLLGSCFKAKNMLDLAVTQFEKALQTEDASTDEGKEILYNLGVTYEAMSKTEEALEAFKKIYEVDINYRDVGQKVENFYKK